MQEESTGSKGFGAQQKPKKRQKLSEKPFQIELPQGNEETPAQQLEGNTVRLLAAIFVLFFAEGILLAIAVSLYAMASMRTAAAQPVQCS